MHLPRASEPISERLEQDHLDLTEQDIQIALVRRPHREAGVLGHRNSDMPHAPVLRDEVLANGLGDVAEAEVLPEEPQGTLDRPVLLLLGQGRLPDYRLLGLRPIDDLRLRQVPRRPEDDHVQLAELQVDPSFGGYRNPTTVVDSETCKALPTAATHLVQVLVHGASEGREVAVVQELGLGLLDRELLHLVLRCALDDVGVLCCGHSDDVRCGQVPGLEDDDLHIAEHHLHEGVLGGLNAATVHRLHAHRALPHAAARGGEVVADGLGDIGEGVVLLQRLDGDAQGLLLHLLGHGAFSNLGLLVPHRCQHVSLLRGGRLEKHHLQ
mmetsp:Transcript_51229/g.147904  ORF Transcript_51229/g.147904 Transcript_51229/m.147904 type:complete len:325 (+) Transcript_51229:163-1137(+)